MHKHNNRALHISDLNHHHLYSEVNSDFSLMGSSSAAVVSSSSAPPPWWAPKGYDVFISFRGQDTRSNFTSHLHAALCRKNITTFVDYKLKKGDPISTLFPTIENSRFAVIVFSKDYASSKWCLDELVKILECKKTHGQVVIPVFYNVEPSDVKNQTGSYAKSFAKHARKQIPKTTMQEWEKALREACSLSGWNSVVTWPDSILTEEIVKDICRRLNGMYQIPDNSLIGIDPKVKVIESWLCSGSREVCVVGIWGISGIGKTTLARFIFNKIRGEFEGACFIEDIGRRSQNDRLLLGPQQQLCATLLGEENIKIGYFNILPSEDARFYRKKLLVVFDDVTQPFQVEKLFGRLDNWPNTGSRFIITSRDQRMLHCCNQKQRYKLNELSKDESLQLFSRYAFKQEVPMVEYIELSIKIVKYTKGVPLALKVLGASLFGKPMEVWDSTIEKLERNPNKEILDILQISYDGLDEDQKNIFLDIACFFRNTDWESLVEYFDGCDFKATVDLDTLIDKCLIDKDKRGWNHEGVVVRPLYCVDMHDLLQKMAMVIVRRESIDDPSKRSRLWHHEDISQVLRDNTGTEAIQGIMLDMLKMDDINLQKDAFRKMKNLRILDFSSWTYGVPNKVHIPHGVDFVLNKLRYFRWKGCPLKSLQPDFNPKNLVKICITDSDIEQLWNDQPLPKLRSLYLGSCNKLTSIPSLSTANKLDSLEIHGCSSLRSLSPPAHLRTLDISGCANLEVIPELPSTVEYFDLAETAIEELSCISHLSRLKWLYISDCPKLKCLLNNIHELKSLVDLHITECENFCRLPHHLGDLDALHTLYIIDTAVQALPSSICNLKNLRELYVSRNKKLASLPYNIGNLESLIELYAYDTALEELPSSIGSLSRLAELSLYSAKLKCLPSSISKLKSLKRLDLRVNKELQRLPHDLGSLEGLEELDAGDTAIEELPLSIGCLYRLTSLWLNNAKLKCLPRSFCKLKSLKRLDLSGNKELQRLPHNLGSLENLAELDVSGTSVEELPSSMGDLSELVDFDPSYCSKLKYMPSSIAQFLSGDRRGEIRTLSLIGCYSLDWKLPKEIMEEALLKEIYIASQLEDRAANQESLVVLEDYLQPKSVILYPGREIPEWFSSRNDGYSVTLTLPKELSNSRTVCFALSAVVDLPCEDIAFRCKLKYKDGHAQDRKISMRGNPIPYVGQRGPCPMTPYKPIRIRITPLDRLRMMMSKSKGSHVIFGDLCVDCPTPISDLQSARLSCKFYAYKRKESGELMKCFDTVKACGVHHVSQNQNKQVNLYQSGEGAATGLKQKKKKSEECNKDNEKEEEKGGNSIGGLILILLLLLCTYCSFFVVLLDDYG